MNTNYYKFFKWILLQHILIPVIAGRVQQLNVQQLISVYSFVEATEKQKSVSQYDNYRVL